jgi:predicted metal-dependent peptidase
MNREKRVDKAQLKVLFTVPFFAPGVARLPVVWDENIETACTDGQRILWNPKFFDRCTDPELVTVMCEEVGHCLFGHLWRAPADARTSSESWTKWNRACDQAVRWMMKEVSEQVTGRGLADPFPFPDKEQAEPQTCYRGFAEEQVYRMMPQSPPPGGGKSGQGQGKAFAEFSKPSADRAQQKRMKTEWESALMQSVAASKQRGNIPGCLKRYVDGLVSPEIPWWELVRNWLREQCNDDWNWSKPNVYFDESDFILPSLDSERMGAIVFATDTSGSIDAKALKRFQSEKQGCLDDLKPSRLLDIYCDCAITDEREYRPGETISRHAPGGGGTDFRPVFERCNRMETPPKCLVYLTDLHGAFPEAEPDYPVLWVVWSKEKAPFGHQVHIKQ